MKKLILKKNIHKVTKNEELRSKKQQEFDEIGKCLRVKDELEHRLDDKLLENTFVDNVKVEACIETECSEKHTVEYVIAFTYLDKRVRKITVPEFKVSDYFQKSKSREVYEVTKKLVISCAIAILILCPTTLIVEIVRVCQGTYADNGVIATIIRILLNVTLYPLLAATFIYVGFTIYLVLFKRKVYAEIWE